MKLYEVSAEMQDVLNNLTIDEETGEINNIEVLEEVKEKFQDKIESVALYIKGLQAEIKAFDEEIALMQKRKAPLVKNAEWLTNYLSTNMQRFAVDSVDTPRVVVSFRKSQAVSTDSDFMDWAMINGGAFLRYAPATYEVNKKAIKDALKQGIEVPHVVIDNRKNITIK